ncbi:MAG: arylsulfatase A [Planctomycetota bacterium]|jgi:arylsulfatase A
MWNRFAAQFLAPVLLLCACHSGGTTEEVGDRRPNIVYILADDMGYGDVSALNATAAWGTPNIDRLAAQGMTFTDAHSGSAVCTPTRYGILTGRYAWRTHLAQGVLWGNSAPLIDAERVTVGDLLQSEGYTTGCFGKWHLGWDWSRLGGDEGAIDFEGPVTNGPSQRGFDESYCIAASLDMPPYVWVQNGEVTAPPDRETENTDYQGFWRKGSTGADFEHGDVLPEVSRRAVDFIEQQSGGEEPFFLYLPLPAPHTPILPTEDFLGASGTNAYGDFVLQVDHVVGQVLEALEENGCADNTLVVFTSDNGCSPRAKFDELAEFGHDPSFGFRGYKADIFEGGHRVPFLVRWPGLVAPESRSSETVCLTDLMATSAAILGRPLPAGAGPDSVSLLPSLLPSLPPSLRAASPPTGPVPGGREAVIHHSINGSFAVRRGPWKLILCPGSGGWSAPKPKAARDKGLPAWQLYNLDTDPGETDNVAEDHPEICANLQALLDAAVEQGRSTRGEPQANDRVISYPRVQ